MIDLLARIAICVALLAAAGAARAAELVMFETEGCPWCAAWDREVGVVYHKTAAGRRAPLRRVDLYGSRPEDLLHLSGVVYTPTFVLVDGGEEIGRILGYPGEDHFWGLLDELVRRLDADPPSATACTPPSGTSLATNTKTEEGRC